MQMRITNGIVFAILGMMMIATVLAVWFGVFRAAPQQLTETPRAVITESRGKVTLTRDGASIDVRSGAAVLPGDVLTTGEASTATIIFFSSARTALDANSSLRIDAAVIDPAMPQRQNVKLTLIGGRVWSRILKLLDIESSYGVEFNGVVSGVRGTAFDLTGRGSTAIIDVFDGTIGVSGKIAGNVPEGFSARIDTVRPSTVVDDVLYPTPDAARNDSWVQEQLDEDATFSSNVINVRDALGVPDAIAEYKEVQKDADSGVLRDPGVDHSDYERLSVFSPTQQYVLSGGAPLQLQARAIFLQAKGQESRDVTAQADWFVSHPDRASVKGGVVTLAPATAGGVTGTTKNDANSAPQNATPGVADGTVEVVARWYDGTHEHSAAVTVLLVR